MTADAVSPSTSAPSLDSHAISEPPNLPSLPAALLPYAGLLFQRFPEVLLALGNPALGKEFDLPPAKGSFAIVEETGSRKLVQVVLSRCASRGGHGHEIIPGVCQKPHRLRDIFCGERDTAERHTAERPHIPPPKVRWNDKQSEWEAIRLNPGLYDIVGPDVTDRVEVGIAPKKHDHADSRQSRPAKSKASKHSKASAATLKTATTRGDVQALHEQPDNAQQAGKPPAAEPPAAEPPAAKHPAAMEPAALDPFGAQQSFQPAGTDASAAQAAAPGASEHQKDSTSGHVSQPASKAPLISWAGHSCASQSQQLRTPAYSPPKGQTQQPARETTKMHPMPLQEPESPRSPGNFNPWADEVVGHFSFGPRERRRSDPHPAMETDEAPSGFGLGTMLRRGPAPAASLPDGKALGRGQGNFY